MEELTKNNFASMADSVPVAVVQFWAAWDRAYDDPVKATLADLEPQYADRIVFGRLNVEEAPDLANAIGIVNLPTVGYFFHGKPELEVGTRSKERVVQRLEDLLSRAQRLPDEPGR